MANLNILRILVTALALDVLTVSSVPWLSIATVSKSDSVSLQSDDCDRLSGLNRRQKRICRNTTETMDAVREGAIMAIDECQHQFQSNRWNCPVANDSTNVFGRIANSGTKESAFIQAISSAGVALSITLRCSSGELSRCDCDRSLKGTLADGFQWAGCSDNTAYGIAFAKNFIDARETGRGTKDDEHRLTNALLNLHNNDAGRKTLEMHRVVNCKCHGVSGSCEIKTCWKSAPSFRRIGNALKAKFDAAKRVQQKRIGSKRLLVKVAGNVAGWPKTKAEATGRSSLAGQTTGPVDRDSLVYYSQSPDFCEPNPKFGFAGTRGRTCNRTSRERDDCEMLCCGRGYEVKETRVIERCRCKFRFCCEVLCDICTTYVEQSVCR